MAKSPSYGGHSLCCQAINDKLSQAVPSAGPVSLKPPPCQHPPSPSSQVGPLCEENTLGEERWVPRERERGETGAGGAAGKGGQKGAEGDGGETGDEGARGKRVRKELSAER